MEIKSKNIIVLILGLVFIALIYLTSNTINQHNSQALPTAWSTLFPLPTVPKGFPTPYPPSLSHYYSGDTYKILDYLITTWDSQLLDESRQAITISSPNQKQISISDWSVNVGRIHHKEYNLQNPVEWFQDNVSEDINGDGNPEIAISTSKGGNDAHYVLFVFSLEKQPLLIFKKPYFADYYFKDIDNDGIFELLIKQTSLNKFLPGSGLGEFIPMTEIYKYVQGKGYIQASCKFPETFEKDISMLEVSVNDNVKSGNPTDARTIYTLAIYYSYIGEPELAAKIINEYIPQKNISKAEIVLHELQNDLQSELCP